MFDVNALSSILSTRNGVWTLVALAILGLWRGWSGLPAVMAQWTARRQAIAAEKAADWQRLRDEVSRLGTEVKDLKGETKSLHDAVRECEERELDWHRRAIDAEAKLQNEGRLKQELAKLQAADRADPDNAPTTVRRFNGDKNGNGGGK